ncbi:MAG: hypothetical protein J6B80_04735 [Clostridia bacterium]|nr:hypothetical protein [Clostridia bacterium]
MKKFAAITLIFIMLLSFCGCNSTKLTPKNLAGAWDAEISMRDYIEMTSKEIIEDDGTIPKEYINKIYNLKYATRIVYYKDGTCETKVSKDMFDKLLEDELEILLDYYADEGLLLVYQALGVEANTNEELEAFLIANGSTFKDALDAIEITLLGVVEKSKKELAKELGELKDDGYYTVKEKFTVTEDSIKYVNKDDKEKITYCKLTDKNTLVVNKMYYDYEEYNVNITFKRVK